MIDTKNKTCIFVVVDRKERNFESWPAEARLCIKQLQAQRQAEAKENAQQAKEIGRQAKEIGRQAKEIGQQAKEIGRQAKENARQADELITLKALVEGLRERLEQNSSNSSKPPSSDSPSQRLKNREKRRRKTGGRKRGGQPGHKGHTRELLPIDDVDAFKPYYPAQCENCWQPLSEAKCDNPVRHQVTELTGKGGVKVTEYQRHFVCCPGCGYVSLADGGKVPNSSFGPRLCSTIAMLTGVFHLSRRQAKKLLIEVFGIKISIGSISNIEKRITELLAPAYEEAKAHADQAAVKHTDGTGWRQSGTSMQLWTVATSAVTVFTIVANGSAATLRALFGCIKGVLVSDRATAINFWAMKHRQICWSHLLRKFISFSERDGPAGKIGKELVETTCVMFENYRSMTEGKISRRIFRERMAPLRLLLEALLQKAVDAKLKRFSGACRNMLKHRDAFWTFVDRAGVEPTNNHAERELRAFVLWRRRSFGTQSDRGNRFAERIMTVVHSLRKQRRPVLAYLTALTMAKDANVLPQLLAA